MTDKLEGSVRKVVAGGFFIFVGTILGNLFGFGGKVIITRLTTPEAFGVFSLCVGVVSLINLFSNFGLSIGVARYSAFYLGQGDKETARAIMLRLMRIGLVASIAMLCVFYLSATVIGNKLFGGITGIGPLLKIVFLSIPFAVFVEMLVGTGRGHGDGLPKVLFMDIARNGLFVVALVVLIPLGLSDTSIIWAYVISAIATAVLAFGYGSRRYGYGFFETSTQPVPLREILYFSIPMAVLPMMWMVLTYVDTIMLGYYMKAEDVGFYNSASILSRLFNPILTAAAFIFLPIATGLFARNSHEEFSRIYEIITKWVFVISVPFAAVLFVCHTELLSLIFGIDFAFASGALRILVVGFVFSTLFSMNTPMLTASGHSREQMMAAVITMATNVFLCVILIPRYGINGAAVATSFSTAVYNVTISYMLFRHTKIASFSMDYAKTIMAAGLALVVVMSMGFVAEGMLPAWRIALTGVIYSIIFLICFLGFKCITLYDVIILNMVEQKTGKDLSALKAIVMKFSAERSSQNGK
ncbi:MAG: flippase [Deltaproteobacteria bacterium]|nr:flippase [Deltaproteobacteria bacterium]